MTKMLLNHEIMYRASVEKNPEFEGVFWMGVKTTGIFCRPTCTARKPKSENVEFFFSVAEAMEKGYRPCKICRPLENPGTMPEAIAVMMNELTGNPDLKITDEELKKRNLEPATVRRWFLKHYGMTFQQFQRSFRLNAAMKKLQQGNSVFDAAYDSGFESLSGFQEGFKKLFGVAPSQRSQQKVMDVKRIETPLGTMYAGAVEQGICMLEFGDRSNLPETCARVALLHDARVVPGANVHFDHLETELQSYFAGALTSFTVPLAPAGTDFQKRVWQTLQQIPYGERWTYRQQAAKLGNERKVRAVANANGLNRISIVIPCHRVIGSDGNLTGYGGGVWRKQKLLDLERSVIGGL